MMRPKMQQRSGHAETLPGCTSLLLSIVFLTILLRVPEVRSALRSLDFGTARLALILLWGLCLLAGLGLVILASRILDRRAGQAEFTILCLLEIASTFLTLGLFELAHLKPVFKSMPAP